VTLQTLGIDVPGAQGSAVRVDGGGGVRLAGVSAIRSAASTSNQPLVDVAGAAAITQGSLLAMQSGSNGTAAIAAAGAGGVQISDAIAVNTVGPAAVFSASDKNSIVRSTLASTEAASDAVQLNAASAGARKLVSDSSVLVGGANGAGLRVKTRGAPTTDTTSLVLRHATIMGSKSGLVLDATQEHDPVLGTLILTPAGNITATVGSSIVHGASSANGDPGALLSPASTVQLTLSASDMPTVGSNAQATIGGSPTSNTPDDQLFGKGAHLRADAPVIDKGEAPAADESQTDIDGQPRVNGPASDIGADEFVNSAPVASLTASNGTPLQGEAVTFTSTSTDPDVGDALTKYFWDFGDGQNAITDGPTVAHAYPNIGTYNVRFGVQDRAGAVSEIVTLPITVRDGSPPVVKISTPKHRATLRLNPKARKHRKGKKAKRPRPIPLTVIGSDSDASGVQSVEIALTYRGKKAKSKRCRQYTGRSFKRAGCGKLVWVKARLSGDQWQLVTRRGVRLTRGWYDLRARGTDANGLTSTTFKVKDGSRARFRVR
jgi:PKD repeat protein